VLNGGVNLPTNQNQPTFCHVGSETLTQSVTKANDLRIAIKHSFCWFCRWWCHWCLRTVVI